ncbi:hypothetical protein [Pedococcus sp. P5_B7]
MGSGTGFTGFDAVDGRSVGERGVVVVVVVVDAAVLLVAAVVADVGLAARGVCAAPAQALSARQAVANQTVCRMVTEGNPRSRPPAFRR